MPHPARSSLPIFVKLGSILPFGSDVLSTHEDQKLVKLKIYRDANADLTLTTTTASATPTNKTPTKKPNSTGTTPAAS